MSEIKVSKLTNRAGTGAPDFSQGVKISGTASTLLAPTRTESATEPTSPSNGDTWYDTDNDYYDIYINDEWKRFIGEGGGASFTFGGEKAYYLRDSTFGNTFSISTAANAVNVSITRSINQTYGAAGSNGTKIVFAGGQSHDDALVVTSATGAGSTVSGALSSHTVRRYHAAASNGTTLHLFGGQNVENPDDSTEYLTIDSFSTSTVGGNLTGKVTYPVAVGDATYGVRMGGGASGSVSQNTMDYVTIGTTGAATDFGDLTAARRVAGSAEDATRGLTAGGIASVTNDDGIDYITTATPSNATDFGNLSVGRYACSGCSNGTRAAFVAGYQSSGTNDTIDFVVIQTLSNATDFGDLTVTNQQYGTAGAGNAS